MKMDEDRLAINANHIQVMVPDGDRDRIFPWPKRPHLCLLWRVRPANGWDRANLDTTVILVVQHLNAHVVEQGPLFVAYSVTYTFTGDRSDTVESENSAQRVRC